MNTKSLIRSKINKLVSFSIYTFFVVLTVFLSSCGKHESTGTVFGAATGALAGAAVSNKKERGTGTLIGALVGTCLGSAIGRAADEEENDEERQIAQNKIASLKEENRELHQNQIRWCSHCGRQFDLLGAHICPDCGGELIREKYCKECHTHFTPRSGYRYCPYCTDRVQLSCR
jgi:predicted RNA-binding Zn-ribbon protein involved in translation (DUF1610 family)/preprotein translocase subunit SecG